LHERKKDSATVDRKSLHGIRKGSAEVESGSMMTMMIWMEFPQRKKAIILDRSDLQTPLERRHSARLIRVLSFDPTREITQHDLATLKLMGAHLSTKMAQFAPNWRCSAAGNKSSRIR